MSQLVKAIQKDQTKVRTENGAKTFSSSLNANLDLFFMSGASRNRSDDDLIKLFSKAFAEDKDTALKILAYVRDCRGGMGERRFFRTAIKYLASTKDANSFDIQMISELGRWDDLLVLFGTSLEKDVLSFITSIFKEDSNDDGLFFKWMPRKGEIANKIRKQLKLTPKEYRKFLVERTKVVETQMCNKEWDDINYSHVPTMANVKYNKAFLRNDESRRREFLGQAVKGEVKINSSVAFPDDVLFKTGARGDWQTATAMWNQLPNYLEDSNVRILPICDTSGSMIGRPLEISVSLGMYISERNNSIFKDAFVTFSSTPELQYLTGDLWARYSQLLSAEWGQNTNLKAVFDLVLNKAIKHKISQDEMPTHLLIISDMEFDQATRHNGNDATLYKVMKDLYKQSGYELPSIIFWNVNSRQDNVPVRFNQDGVGLISGASPAVLKAVLSGNINPMDIMMRAIDQEKYQNFVNQ